MTLVQTEPKKILYGIPIIISDTQGPCSDGFHIPTRDDWTNIIGVCNSLGTNMWILKLPIPGYRDTSNPSLGNLGTAGGYWTCIGGTSYAYQASCLWIRGGSVQGLAEKDKTMGFSIRPFKSEAVTPDNSWTVLKQGTGTAGIYYKSDLGLISLSSNGTTRYTIADKNLGATTVYNSGDTLTDDNCGYLYQRGNNYGFAHSGTITTSGTRVDGSSYGPGNYYSSSTFVTNYANWDTSANQNLWGGVTQGSSTKGAVKAVYLGDTKVRPTTIPAVWDYISTYTSGSAISNQNNFYGICITPKVNCTINKVKFFISGNISCTLKIAQGSYASASGTTYSVSLSSSSGGIYELGTPYQLTAGVNYVISARGSGLLIGSMSDSFPVDKTNVTFQYGTQSGRDTTYSAAYAIHGLETQAT